MNTLKLVTVALVLCLTAPASIAAQMDVPVNADWFCPLVWPCN